MKKLRTLLVCHDCKTKLFAHRGDNCEKCKQQLEVPDTYILPEYENLVGKTYNDVIGEWN